MPVLDLSGVIRALKSGTYTVTRYAAGDYDEGVYEEGATSTFTIDASVQPAGGKDLERLPEGERLKDYLTVLTPTELRTRADAASPDRVSIDGATYEVVEVADWFSEGNFYRALVHRLEAP